LLGLPVVALGTGFPLNHFIFYRWFIEGCVDGRRRARLTMD